MNRALLLLLPLLLSLNIPSTQSQEEMKGQGGNFVSERNESKETGLESLLNKVYLAYGGKENLAKLGNNYQILGEQTLLAENNSPETKKHFRKQRRQDAIRIDIEGSPSWTSTVYDGRRAWRAKGESIVDLDPDETQILLLEKDKEFSLLAHFGESNYIFKMLGSTRYRAVPAFAIEVSRAGNSPFTVYVDQKNYLVIGLSYNGSDSGHQVLKSIDYSEYRPCAKSLMPFKQVEYINEEPKQELDLQSVEIGTINDDELFKRPDQGNDIRLEKAVYIPFLYSHKELLVKVRINDGEPLDFLLDTGASQTLIDRRTAAESLLERKADLDLGAAGGSFTGQATEINKLGLSGINLREIKAVIVDLSGHARQLGKPIAGVLGTNVLSHFAVSIDYGKSQIILRDYSTYKPPAGASIVPFNDKKGPVVTAILNGQEEVLFVVDTGAAFNNLPAGIAKKYSSGQTGRYTEGVGVDGKTVRLGTMNIRLLKLGTSLSRNISFTYSIDQDPGNNKKGFVTSSNMGILGNPFWQNYTITMDYRTHQLVLQPNASLASRQELEQLVATGDSKLNVYREYKTAQASYLAALTKVQALVDPRQQARVWGRLGNVHRLMAKDLGRPEQARIAYEYFSKAKDLAHKTEDREIEGRILADWALLYMDNGQLREARQALDAAMVYSAQDPQVNVNFAVYLNKLRAYGDMRAYIDKALFLDPSNWQALWYRLKLAETFNDTNQQKDTLKDILRYYSWSKIAQDKLTALTKPQAQLNELNTPNLIPVR